MNNILYTDKKESSCNAQKKQEKNINRIINHLKFTLKE